MDLEQTAIQRLRAASEMALQVYKTPLVITDSGGKDSSICTHLAERAGIPFEVMHNHTTADAPETVYFIRKKFQHFKDKGIKCAVNMPVYKGKRTSMWNLIPQKLMPPTRLVRYCCSVLKERGGSGRFITTGVRWAESVKRKNSRGIYETMPSDISKKVILNNDNDDRRRLFETCTLKAKRICNHIVDWKDSDVWDYIEAEKIEINPLYECGYSRVGCIGCPMAGTAGRQKEFFRYPQYEKMYIRAFDNMIKERLRRNLPTDWQTGLDCFHWWMEDGVLPRQMEFSDLADYEEEYEIE